MIALVHAILAATDRSISFIRRLQVHDQLELPDGRIIDAHDLEDEAIADAVRDYLQGMPCPRCGHAAMRITLPPDVI